MNSLNQSLLKKTTLLLAALLFTCSAWTQNCVAEFTYTDNGSGNFSFVNTSVGDFDYPYYYFGDNSYSSLENPTHQYNADGVYAVCLYIENNDSTCFSYYCDTIVIDGLSPSCFDPSIIDSTAGCFTVFDPVCGCDGNTYNNECEASNWYGITTWTAGPCNGSNSCNAAFSFTVDSTANFTIFFAGNSQHDEHYWDFDDGAQGSGIHTQHSFPQAGTYNVCQTASNNSPQCTDTQCIQVVISSNNNCIDPSMIDSASCPSVFEPVCGCDGVTYNNSCQAESWHGVISWTAGACGGQSNCTANFDYSVTQNGQDYTVSFNSAHSYIEDSSYFWSFGDGSHGFFEDGDHIYSSGVYEVCLEIYSWDTGSFCTDEVCQTLYLGEDSLCFVGGCVFPGDAGFNMVCDNFDVLTVGQHYGDSGTVRPFATNDWHGQYCEDWGFLNIDGTDLKHTDCNGDGIIDHGDMVAIGHNYNRIHNGLFALSVEGAPSVYLVFDADSIYLNPDGSNLTLNADIMVATSTAPATDLYGLAFSINYDHSIVEPGSIQVDYAGDNWFGQSASTLQLAVDLENSGQVDIAYSRTDHTAVNGYGKIGTFQFTIRDDIIGRSTLDETPFPIEIHRVRALNAAGSAIPLNGSTGGTILLTDAVSNIDFPSKNQVLIYPNPAESELIVETGNLSVQSVEIFNAIGQRVLFNNNNSSKQTINVSNLETGIYIVAIHSKEGSFNQKLIIR